ncbi:MAG: hypothetical protein COB53_00265 [Elusimicrobia bacterium]|nr:MAG: hypothetical protein COB53_00265 [Elusimicrobiota bacterium]
MAANKIIADIDAIIRCEPGYPIEEMSRLIEAGNDSVPELKAALLAGLHEEHEAVLHLTVVLGEIQTPVGISLLADMLKTDCGEFVLDAAAEALGKIGEPAIPMLRDMIANELTETAYWAVGALGYMKTQLAREDFVGALGNHLDLAGLAAMYLADLDNKEDVATLYTTYQELSEFDDAIPNFEEAIRHLAGSERYPDIERRESNWRTRWRYRPSGEWTPMLSPLIIGHVLRENPVKVNVKLKSLDKILSRPKDTIAGSDAWCQHCGEEILSPYGVPVCPETAYGGTLYGEDVLKRHLSARRATIPAALNQMDQLVIETISGWSGLSERERDCWRLEHSSLEFLMLDGANTLEEGVARIREIRQNIGSYWKLPRAEFHDESLLKKQFLLKLGLSLDEQKKDCKTVGRNDTCPCGSGRKFKKCCGR